MVTKIPVDRRGLPRLRLRLPVCLGEPDAMGESRGESVEISEDSARLLVEGGGGLRVGQKGRVRFQVDEEDLANLPSAARRDRTISVLRVGELEDGRRQVVVRFI